MTKNELMKVFEECERIRQGIRTEITMPSGDIEIIINSYKSLENKRKHYDKFFNDKLVNTKNDKIKIIDARPIQIKLRNKEITLFKEI